MTKALTQEKVRELLEEGRRNMEESRKPKLPGDYSLGSYGLRGRKTKRKCSVCKEGTVECLYTRIYENPDYAIYGPGAAPPRYDSSYRCDSCGLCYDLRGLKSTNNDNEEG